LEKVLMPTQNNEAVPHFLRAMLRHDGGGLTDGQLLGCFLERRDEAAVAALVRRHGPMVWGVCRRVLRNHHDAEDAFQATFLVLVRRAASVSPRELVGNWLYGVAHQTALKARALLARRRTWERQLPVLPEPPAEQPDLWHDLQPLLDQELSRLPDKYRVAIVLCDLEGKTRKVAARTLGCPEGTLASWLARGRARLAKRLARHGLAVSGVTLAGILSEKTASASVPASVVSATTQIVTGHAAAVAISARVAALAEGVLQTMMLSKIKIAAMVALLVTVLGTGLGAGLFAGPTQPPAEQKRTGAADVQRRLQELDDRVQALTDEVRALRKELKKPAGGPAAPPNMQIFHLRNVYADEMAKILDELFNHNRKPKRVFIRAEERTNSLIVRGEPNDLRTVAALVSRLEDEATPKGPTAGKSGPPASENDLVALQGTWVVVSQQIFGPKQAAAMKYLEWAFEDRRVTAHWVLASNLDAPAEGSFGEGKLGLTFTIDPAQSPRGIDFTVVKNGAGKFSGIYKLEKDTLILATFVGAAEKWEKRPTGFTARDADANGPPLVVCEMKRKKTSR
jgi:RNA polymerase sigma factor (sigma-70 family)